CRAAAVRARIQIQTPPAVVATTPTAVKNSAQKMTASHLRRDHRFFDFTIAPASAAVVMASFRHLEVPRICSIRRPRRCWGPTLGEHFFDEVAVDVGEAEVAALEAVGEALVVEAEEVEDGSLEVVDVVLFLDGGEAEVVGLANNALSDAAAGDPHGEGVDVMVAADGDADLAHRRAAEFAAPDDERVFQ